LCGLLAAVLSKDQLVFFSLLRLKWSGCVSAYSFNASQIPPQTYELTYYRLLFFLCCYSLFFKIPILVLSFSLLWYLQQVFTVICNVRLMIHYVYYYNQQKFRDIIDASADISFGISRFMATLLPIIKKSYRGNLCECWVRDLFLEYIFTFFVSKLFVFRSYNYIFIQC